MVSTRQQCSGASTSSAAESANVSETSSGSRTGRMKSASSNVSAISKVTTKPETREQRTYYFMDLPTELLELIISNLSFKEVARMREVSARMDKICSSRLNTVFFKLQGEMLTRFQEIKAKMPRRESARRQHPLASESDIIETLHMRLSLLQMTFGKHIERGHCCFFAGEILDEVYRILNYVNVTQKLGRPYKVTDELFDLTSMAMEYFKEKIEPSLPEIMYFRTGELLDLSSPLPDCPCSSPKSPMMIEDTPTAAPSEPPASTVALRKRIRKITRGMRRCSTQLATLQQQLRTCKSKMADQQKTIIDYSVRLDENDRKSEEMSRKFSTLLQELNKCKTELQYWRSKSPLNNLCGSCGNPVAAVTDEDLRTLSNQGIIIPMEMITEDDGKEADGDLENADKKNEVAEAKGAELTGDIHGKAGTSGEDAPEAAETEAPKRGGLKDADVAKRATTSKRKHGGEHAVEAKKAKTAEKPRSSLNLRSKCNK